jgi:hypothetical protein
MTTFRCPKHDITFEANKAPTQDGHAKCPLCNPPANESADPGKRAADKEKELKIGID